MGKTFPLRLVSADTVEQIKDWILLVLRIARRRIHIHLAGRAHSFGLVFNHLELSVGNALAGFVDTCRRIVGRLLVVRPEDNRAPETSGAASPGGCRRIG